MTREEILVLPAGAEMDALVAERVMGWLRIGPDEPYRFHKEMGGIIGPDGRPARFAAGEIPFDWFPSTRIADAWDVVEKLAGGLEEGDRFEVIRLGETVWRAGFTIFVTADTAQLAICRAALLVEGS